MAEAQLSEDEVVLIIDENIIEGQIGFEIPHHDEEHKVDEAALRDMSITDLRLYIRNKGLKATGCRKAPLLKFALEILKAENGDKKALTWYEEQKQSVFEEKEEELLKKEIDEEHKELARDGLFLVEEILDHRRGKTEREYKIQWAQSGAITWEPESNIRHLDIFPKYESEARLQETPIEDGKQDVNKQADLAKEKPDDHTSKKLKETKSPQTALYKKSKRKRKVKLMEQHCAKTSLKKQKRKHDNRAAHTNSKYTLETKKNRKKLVETPPKKWKNSQDSTNLPRLKRKLDAKNAKAVSDKNPSKKRKGKKLWEVENILDDRKGKSENEYKIRWAHSGAITWEPESNIRHLEMFPKYAKIKRNKSKKKKKKLKSDQKPTKSKKDPKRIDGVQAEGKTQNTPGGDWIENKS